MAVVHDKSGWKIKFKEVKQLISYELEKKGKYLGINEPYTIIDGFSDMTLRMEVTDQYMLGGGVVPMIMVLGKESGRIYFFALKAILKDLPCVPEPQWLSDPENKAIVDELEEALKQKADRKIDLSTFEENDGQRN